MQISLSHLIHIASISISQKENNRNPKITVVPGGELGAGRVTFL